MGAPPYTRRMRAPILLGLAFVLSGAAAPAAEPPPGGPPDDLALLAGAYEVGARLVVIAPFRAGDAWKPLLADAQTDRLRLLFPAPSGDGFVIGAELARPEPVEAHVAFDRDRTGRATALRVRPAGAPAARVASRVPLRSVEVAFARAGVSFRGTLHLPRGGGRAPAVVLAHGSEANDRWSFGPVPLVLAASGYAVLAWDKRGTGASGGDWRPAGPDVLAADLAAAVDAVARRGEIDPARIAVVGLSEGGWIAPFAAALTPRIRAIAAICGGARTKGDAYVHKVRRQRQAAGATGEAVAAAVRAAEAEIADSHERVRSGREVRGFDRRVTYDPGEHWRRFRGPVLYLGGEADVLESAPDAAAWFERLFAEAGHGDLTIRVWPRAHHSLLLGVTGDPAEFETLAGIGQLAPGYWDVLLRWLETRLARPPLR
jgi:pimeloyl-ACP methyl ester carboxylesterase